MRKINDLNLLHQLNHSLHKRQMRRVLMAIVLPISLVFKFNYECVRDTVLLELVCTLDKQRKEGRMVKGKGYLNPLNRVIFSTRNRLEIGFFGLGMEACVC